MKITNYNHESNANLVAININDNSIIKNNFGHFIYNDSLDNYLKNKSRLDEWHWSNKIIHYDVNELGYRTKKVNDNSDYFIVYGCSETWGVGLDISSTWHNKLSCSLNMLYENWAASGGSCELIAINSMLYLKNSTTRPKFVVIQWPNTLRSLYHTMNKLYFWGVNFPQNDFNDIEFREWKQSQLLSDSPLYTSYYSFLYTTTLWSLANIPVYHWTYDQCWLDTDFNHKINFIKPTLEEVKEINLARDLMHMGTLYNTRVKDILYETITSNH